MTDEALLAAYCQIVADHREAVRHLKAEGHVSESTRGTPTRNPWSLVAREARQQMPKEL